MTKWSRHSCLTERKNLSAHAFMSGEQGIRNGNLAGRPSPGGPDGKPNALEIGNSRYNLTFFRIHDGYRKIEPDEFTDGKFFVYLYETPFSEMGIRVSAKLARNTD